MKRRVNRALLNGMDNMNTVIELESELMIDTSTIQDPYLRLMAIAIGKRIIRGSPWLTIDRNASEACIFCGSLGRKRCELQGRQIRRNC
jgi:hypothetical protein